MICQELNSDQTLEWSDIMTIRIRVLGGHENKVQGTLGWWPMFVALSTKV